MSLFEFSESFPASLLGSVPNCAQAAARLVKQWRCCSTVQTPSVIHRRCARIGIGNATTGKRSYILNSTAARSGAVPYEPQPVVTVELTRILHQAALRATENTLICHATNPFFEPGPGHKPRWPRARAKSSAIIAALGAICGLSTRLPSKKGTFPLYFAVTDFPLDSPR